MKLAALFTDHLVLQREKPIAVWGTADAGDSVAVSFAGQTKTAVAEADGRWRVALDALPASAEPRELTVRSQATGETLRIADVLVGEVWLASGQSNMAWRIGDSYGADAAKATADDALLRLFTVPQRASDKPTLDLADATWQHASPTAIWPFSAVAYYFARQLRRELNVPVGMIHASWGGTRIEAWMRRDALVADPAGRLEVADYEAVPTDSDEGRSKLEFAADPVAWERARTVADPGDTGTPLGFAQPDFDDAAWPEMELPARWQARGHKYSGVFWFRREVQIPAAWAGRDLMLHLGAADKHDTTSFNGTFVGSIGWETRSAWNTPRHYVIPAHLVRAGRNVIATRVFSYMTDGGLIGPPDAMRLTLKNDEANAPIPLAGKWRYMVEHNIGQQPVPNPPLGPGNANVPATLFDNMIAPLLPFTLRGVIWYQGESNARKPDGYRTLFPAMIKHWRDVFAQPQLAFHFVQLANHNAPPDSQWALLREAQSDALALPHTGMAVTLDIGDPGDIHPRNKLDVGLRLAATALATVYHQPVEGTGPTYHSHKVEGDHTRVTFTHATGLRTKDNHPPRGFTTDGAPIAARLDGDTVILATTAPHVRYAWSNNPDVNLYNAAGLPAVPFRTDRAAP